MWKKLKVWWRSEGALVQLTGLSDRLLTDMGLDREDLRNRVYGAAEAAVEAERLHHPLRGPLARGKGPGPIQAH